MNRLFKLGAMAVLVVLGLCCYWHFNPGSAPRFLTVGWPALELRRPESPMSNFRPPQFGP
jgi:hypothetical protein